MVQKSVLLVEDDPLVRRLLHAAIDAEPGLAACPPAQTIAEARVAARTETPDLILIDAILPDGPAFPLVTELRRLCRDARIIGMSASPSDGTRARFARSGADAAVDKRNIGAILELLRKIERAPDAALRP